MKRNEINISDRWNLDVMINGIDIDNELIEIEKIAEEFDKYKDSFPRNLEMFKKSLDDYHNLWRRIEVIYVYYHHKLDEDLSNSKIQQENGKINSFVVKISAQTSFYMPLLVENIDFLKANIEKEEIAEYKRTLSEIIRTSKYVMSSEIENVLSLGGEVFATSSNIYSKFMNVDLKFSNIQDGQGKELELDNSNYIVHMQSQDRILRLNAFQEMYGTLRKYNETMGEIYISEIKKGIFIKNVKNYNSLRQKALFSNGIPEYVYDNLIEVVSENINIHNDYMKVRKENLDVKELKMYDLLVSLHPNFDKKIKYQDAKDIVKKSLKPLGEKYLKEIEKAFDLRYIDVYPNEAKRSGAYSGGCYDSYPYILLNYTDTLNDVYTLTHELGHSMHTHLSNTHQSYQDAGYKIFIAEIASTLNELLLTDYLYDNAETNEEKKYVLNHKLEQYRSTVFRQTMFAEFEFLSKDELERTNMMNSLRLNEIYLELNNKYFGEFVEIDDDIKFEWMRIPHFYYNFYVYQYATSFCAAVDIYKRIKKDESMIGKYLNFLSLGGSVSSLEALKSIGIDFETKNSMQNAMEDFKETLRMYKEL